MATAAVFGFGLSLGGEASFVTAGTARRRVAAPRFDAAFAVDFEAAFGVAPFADVSLTDVVADLGVLVRSGVPDFALAFAEGSRFASTFLGLARVASVLTAGRAPAFAERTVDGADLAGAFALEAVGFVEAVALTAERAFARLALDLASLADLPRGAAAAFVFGDMADHSSWRDRRYSSAARRIRERH